MQKSIASIVIVSLLAGFIGGYAGSKLDTELDSIENSKEVSQLVINNQSDLIAQIADEVGKSTVSIVSTTETESFFGPFEEEGAGTGIILSEDGIVMTNRHVVPEGTVDIEITLSDGTVYSDVEIIGRDPRGGVDLAFLKIQGVSGLTPARIGDSDTMRVGDYVIAIGNALGEFQNSVTTGIISGRSRPVIASDSSGSEALTNLLQTDAAINPGNSGGPLVNLNGEVIGINTAVAEAENIGFSIAISDVKGVIDSVLTTGEIRVPYIGVRYQMITPEYANREDLPVEKGALIRGGQNFPAVIPDSPADKAGLLDGDILTEIDGQELDADSQLGVLIGRKQVGDTLQLKILRDGEEQYVEITLEAAPETF